MQYSRDTIIGDITTYEVFEGTPEEIIELIGHLDKPKVINKTININEGKLVKEVAEEMSRHIERAARSLIME